MKQKLNNIKQTWTYQHKTLILTLALATVILIQNDILPIPKIQAEEITYERAQPADTSLEAKVEQRAEELYNENKNIDLERYRQEAIRETNDYLMQMTYTSPYVDYDALAEKYGY